MENAYSGAHRKDCCATIVPVLDGETFAPDRQTIHIFTYTLKIL